MRRWTAVALFFGFCAVAAGPVALVWNMLRSRDWDERTLRVRFSSVRFEGAGFVFGYLVQNRTYRTARLLPEDTKVRALQSPDAPGVAYANLPAPLVIPPRGEQLVEIRLELPAGRSQAWHESSDENTRRVLQQQLPGAFEESAPVSPLPMRALPPPAPQESPLAVSPREWLAGLDGFEVVNEAAHAHIRFPRKW